MDSETAQGDAPLHPGMTPELPMHVRTRKHAGRIYLGGYQHVVELSDTATFVVRHIDGRRTIADIGAILADEYDVATDEAVADVTELCTELVRDGVLAARDAQAGP